MPLSWELVFLERGPEEKLLRGGHIRLSLQTGESPFARHKARHKKARLIRLGPRLRQCRIREHIREHVGAEIPIDMGHTAVAALSQLGIEERAETHANEDQRPVFPILFDAQWKKGVLV